MHERFERARAAWPTVKVDPTTFDAWIAARAPDTDPDTLPVSDLYLACACASGDPVAIAEFERTYLREVDHAAARVRVGAAAADEARQIVRDLLFVGRSGPPAIATYAGRGDLRGWTRVVAMRELLRLRERDSKEVPIGDEALLDALSPANDPELELARERYRDEFARAFRDALANLPARDRALLRHVLIDGLTLDTIGGMYKVNKSTVSRWIASARQELLETTKENLGAALALSGDEVESVLRVVRSRLDLSVERLLRG
jgi:RNA polymerase sigma-70 factor, ECF subfamily